MQQMHPDAKDQEEEAAHRESCGLKIIIKLLCFQASVHSMYYTYKHQAVFRKANLGEVRKESQRNATIGW